MAHHIKWGAMFLPDTPVLEIIIRGSVTYLAIFILLRIVLKRQSGGNIGMTDGILLVAVIIFWSFFLDWLGFHWPFFQRLLKPPKLLLVQDGKLLRRNMRKELVTEEELMTEIRKGGVDTLEEVAKAYMEGDGNISIIPKEINGVNGNFEPESTVKTGKGMAKA